MPNYRRAFVPGGCYFFTVNLLDRNSRLLIEHIDHLRDAVRETKHRFPFEIDAMVILPDHIHAVWTLPEGDAFFSVRWRWIKIRFSRSIPKVSGLTLFAKRAVSAVSGSAGIGSTSCRIPPFQEYRR
jgi:putative transposase